MEPLCLLHTFSTNNDISITYADIYAHTEFRAEMSLITPQFATADI